MSDTRQVVHDSAFDLIPKNSTFFLIWRVENFELKPIARNDYGKFYNGDAYIVAAAGEFKETVNSQMASHPAKGELYIHIHYWIGSKASQDEAGIAAIKTIEMDDYLGGGPVQHRETEGYESKLFLSYFKSGIRLLVGGVASGFHKVDFTIKPALFQVKGKRNPIVRELQDINWLPFNDGDIFLLATGKYVFVWTGKHANNMEKVAAIRIAEHIREEHSHYGEHIVIVDDGEEVLDLSSDELEEFEKYLPLRLKCVDSYDPKEDETKYESVERADVVLYRCREENDNDLVIQITKVKSGPLVRSDLDSNDAFIVDNDVDGIWVWIGKKASPKERSKGMKYANQLIKQNNYSPKTKISKVIEGAEPIQFTSLFKTWVPEAKPNVNYNRGYVTRVSNVVENKIDTKTVKDDHRLAAETQLLDDGKGQKTCYYVDNSKLIQLSDGDSGRFHKKNCYVIVYKYEPNKAIIYYWFGSESTPEERDIAEKEAIELNAKQLDNKAVLVRVFECREPIHLMFIYGGLMTIYKGRYVADTVLDKNLLQVKGTTEYNCKAVEVEPTAVSLNSNCVFVLSLAKNSFVWAGDKSIGDKREMARKLAQKLGKESQLITEGEESDEFWSALGGKASYESTKDDKLIHDFQSARLFEWRKTKFEEIVHYEQSDLDDTDIIILDAYDVLFIWLGSKIRDKYCAKAVKIVEHFIKNGVQKRPTELPIHVVFEGCEPSNFTGFFPNWNNRFFETRKNNFDDIKREMRRAIMSKFPNK